MRRHREMHMLPIHRIRHCIHGVFACILLLISSPLALTGCSQSQNVQLATDSDASAESNSPTGDSSAATAIDASRTIDAAIAGATGWPARWASRKFYDRPTAFIYAASASGAKEAEQIMRDAGRDFREYTGAPASKGLIIVTDAKDPLPAEAPQLAQIISNRLRSYRTATQPAAAIDPKDDPSLEWTRQKKKFDDAGLPIEAMLRILPCGVIKDDLTQKLGFATNVAMQTPWAAILPTRAACKRSAHELTKAVMKSKDVTLGQRLLIAPWLPMMETMMTDELAAERVVTVFNEDALSRANWDAGRKQAYISDYRESKNRERDKRISSREKDMKAKGATSRPAG